MVNKVITAAIAALTAAFLAFGLFGSGLLVCIQPQVTQIMGNNFSGWDHATYPEEDMQEIAEAVRSFSIDDTGRKQLEDTVMAALAENFPEINVRITGGDIGMNVGGNLSSSGVGMGNLLSIYTLPDSAIEHLQDCIPVFTTSKIGITLSLIFAAAGIILLIVLGHRRLAGWIMFLVPLAVIAIILGLGIWALVDFDSLFAQMHGLFFVGDTWLFPSDSLLITLFPEAFWMGMGIVWVLCSIVFSLIVCLIGKFVK